MTGAIRLPSGCYGRGTLFILAKGKGRMPGYENHQTPGQMWEMILTTSVPLAANERKFSRTMAVRNSVVTYCFTEPSAYTVTVSKKKLAFMPSTTQPTMAAGCERSGPTYVLSPLGLVRGSVQLIQEAGATKREGLSRK